MDSESTAKKRWRSSQRRSYSKKKRRLEVSLSMAISGDNQTELRAGIATPQNSGTHTHMRGSEPRKDCGIIPHDNSEPEETDDNHGIGFPDGHSEIDMQLVLSDNTGDHNITEENENIDDWDGVSDGYQESREPEPDPNSVDRVENASSSKGSTTRLQLDWGCLAALLLSTGTTRLNQSQYEVVRSFLNWRPIVEQSHITVPSVATVKRIRKGAFQRVLVPSGTIMYQVDKSKSGARTAVGRFRSDSQAPVTVVKPSDWAKLDLSTRRLGDLVLGKRSVRREVPRCHFMSIEDTPIVRSRFDALSPFRMSCDGDGFLPLREGSVISVKLNPRDAAERSLVISTFKGLEKNSLTLVCRVQSLFIYERASNAQNPQGEVQQSESIHKHGRLGAKKKRGVGSVKVVNAFVPGDAILTLSPESSFGVNSESNLFLVHRMLRRHEEGDWAVTLIETRKKVNTKTLLQCGEYRRFRVDYTVAHAADQIGRQEQRSAPNEGYLEDGRKYVVYRLLLYCDGFSPNTTRTGSCTGVYMLPVGMDPDLRESAGAVRPLALAPPGVSQNDVMKSIFADILEGTTKGFDMKDASGRDCVLFLDLLGYVADSPAVAASQDVLGHMSNSPCPLCTFKRYDGSGRGGSRYAYSTSIHSSTPTFARHSSRTDAIRKGEVGDEKIKTLGMKPNPTSPEESSSVLLDLSKAMNEAQSTVPLTRNGAPVVPSLFDCYRSTVVAPDHLVLGLCQNVTDTLLKLLTPALRRTAETICKSLLRDNGLMYQEHLFDHRGIRLHSATISEVFSFLLVAPSAFRSTMSIHGTEAVRKEARLILKLLQEFSALISDTYFQPDVSVDGKGEVYRYNEDGGMKRIWSLRRRAVQYVTNLNDCYKALASSLDIATNLDKPNVHRFLELYTHTLPLFGNIRHVQELLFEGAHQALKRGLSRANGFNPQLQAMEHRLANDWKNRLAIECEGSGSNVMEWDEEVCISVLRLLGWDRKSFTDLKSLRIRLSEMFPTPVLHMLQTSRDQLTGRELRSLAWKGDGATYTGPPELYDELEALMKHCESTLRENLTTVLGTGFTREIVTKLHGGAKWTVQGRSGNNFRTLCRISYSDVIQALCPDYDSMLSDSGIKWERSADVRLSPSFWMCCAVIECLPVLESKEIEEIPRRYRAVLCAIVKPLERTGDCYRLVNRERVHSLALVELKYHVRKVMAVHDCDGEEGEDGEKCETRLGGSAVHHIRNIDEGGKFKLYGRVKGFPPRAG